MQAIQLVGIYIFTFDPATILSLATATTGSLPPWGGELLYALIDRLIEMIKVQRRSYCLNFNCAKTHNGVGMVGYTVHKRVANNNRVWRRDISKVPTDTNNLFFF
jgi:hypothetical protein